MIVIYFEEKQVEVDNAEKVIVYFSFNQVPIMPQNEMEKSAYLNLVLQKESHLRITHKSHKASKLY